MIGMTVLPVLLFAGLLHVSVMSAYYYVLSPLFGFVAFVFSLLDIYFVFAKGRLVRYVL